MPFSVDLLNLLAGSDEQLCGDAMSPVFVLTIMVGEMLNVARHGLQGVHWH
jgi:hypothetical protein